MSFNSGLNIWLNEAELKLEFGEGLFYPERAEKRHLNDIRSSLLNKHAEGPEVLYTIAMDVGKEGHYKDLKKRNLLYGIVAYNDGLIGNELVRSQGHIHAVSPSCQSSTPEVYEILQGQAYIYMQEFVGEVPGHCIAIAAKQGDIVIVPPNWAHYTVNASIDEKMLFGAWCIRDYAFEYKEIREKQGLAFYPVMENNQVKWLKNNHYREAKLIEKTTRLYPEFGLSKENIYVQYEKQPSLFEFVTKPLNYRHLWENFQL
ncbi:glucose-6-phosphate isomerase [Enterococcus sp. BWB1-3]|uniref:glucose-6-phosphate isomerase family protein n=1 Tax=unclassified Enterococcus TaxID=2608891 RepID=UPI0019241C5E|nr:MULTISPECIES: glucose-6-phosphate isomerase family protein [unclassified Enterococcus]MBL1229728.1 glucose-6-phosphate isomerase [Enterococcus sp. BWB1-3]MCB5953876.1 glucose-6-phosphate isomerase [Enterococcus sp. CWB-B31]